MSDAQKAAETKVKASAYNGGSDPYASYNYNAPERRRYEENEKMKSDRKAEDARAIFGGHDKSERAEEAAPRQYSAMVNLEEETKKIWEKEQKDWMLESIADTEEQMKYEKSITLSDLDDVRNENVIQYVQYLLGLPLTGKMGEEVTNTLCIVANGGYDRATTELTQQGLEKLKAIHAEKQKNQGEQGKYLEGLANGVDVLSNVLMGSPWYEIFAGPIGEWWAGVVNPELKRNEWIKSNKKEYKKE